MKAKNVDKKENNNTPINNNVTIKSKMVITK